ncbi:MAG: NAD(P)H-dependent oxidoreductase subunit E, partial [Methanobacterium sp.]
MNKELYEILSSYQGVKSDLIPILQDIQSYFGYLPEEVMKEVSRFIGIPESELYGIATFYQQFRFTPIGRKHIVMCEGTACHVKGANKIIESIERHLNIKKDEVTFDLEYS